MNETRYIIYGDDYEFEDIILTSFRYAITRHTYVVDEVLSWIKNNSHLMDGNRRMYAVMLRGLNDVLYDYEVAKSSIKEYERIDYETLVAFKNWLLEFGKGYGWNEEER